MTKDENFVLDKHPKYSNVIIGGGFSGHGFKLAPVVGDILSNLALNSTDSFYQDILSQFSVSHHTKVSTPKSKL